jgi:hypothetical protein
MLYAVHHIDEQVENEQSSDEEMFVSLFTIWNGE